MYMVVKRGQHILGCQKSEAGTSRLESPDYYCKFTRSIEGGSATEMKPINMNVVFIIKIK